MTNENNNSQQSKSLEKCIAVISKLDIDTAVEVSLELVKHVTQRIDDQNKKLGDLKQKIKAE
jgi:hypothetical protein